MASDKDYVQFIVDQIDGAGEISFKSMFGEYGVFADKRIFGLVCDNKLFIKPTNTGRDFIGTVVEAPPYPGAKASFLIEKQVEDREWLSELVRLTLRELPERKPRKKRSKKKND